MSTMDQIQTLLASFDRLSGPEKLVVAREIGRRISERVGASDESLEAELDHLSDELFQMLDREEEVNGADSASW